jgi:hypothetical protein
MGGGGGEWTNCVIQLSKNHNCRFQTTFTTGIDSSLKTRTHDSLTPKYSTYGTDVSLIIAKASVTRTGGSLTENAIVIRTGGSLIENVIVIRTGGSL